MELLIRDVALPRFSLALDILCFSLRFGDEYVKPIMLSGSFVYLFRLVPTWHWGRSLMKTLIMLFCYTSVNLMCRWISALTRLIYFPWPPVGGDFIVETSLRVYISSFCSQTQHILNEWPSFTSNV